MTNTDILTRIRQACNELHTSGHTVTFTEVAARTGLGRTTLYRNSAARELVEQHKNRSTITLTEDVAALVKPTTTPSPSPRSACTRPNSSAQTGHGPTWSTSKSRPRNGCTGSTPNAPTKPSTI